MHESLYKRSFTVQKQQTRPKTGFALLLLFSIQAGVVEERAVEPALTALLPALVLHLSGQGHTSGRNTSFPCECPVPNPAYPPTARSFHKYNPYRLIFPYGFPITKATPYALIQAYSLPQLRARLVPLLCFHYLASLLP